MTNYEYRRELFVTTLPHTGHASFSATAQGQVWLANFVTRLRIWKTSPLNNVSLKEAGSKEYSPSQSWKSPASSWVRHKSAQGTVSLGHVPLQGTSTDWHVPWHVVNSCTSCGSRHRSPHWTHSQLVTWYSPCQWKIHYRKYLSEMLEWSRRIRRREKSVLALKRYAPFIYKWNQFILELNNGTHK